MGPGVGQGEVNPLAVLYRRRLFKRRTQFGVLFGVDPSTPNEDVLGTIPQALYLMNNPQLNPRSTAPPNRRSWGRSWPATTTTTTPSRRLPSRARTQAGHPEVEVCTDYLARVGNRTEAFEDIFWNLINSTEFISRR